MSALSYTITLIGGEHLPPRRIPGTERGLAVARAVAASYLAQYPEYDLAAVRRQGGPFVLNVWREEKK